MIRMSVTYKLYTNYTCLFTSFDFREDFSSFGSFSSPENTFFFFLRSEMLFIDSSSKSKSAQNRTVVAITAFPDTQEGKQPKPNESMEKIWQRL